MRAITRLLRRTAALLLWPLTRIVGRIADDATCPPADYFAEDLRPPARAGADDEAVFRDCAGILFAPDCEVHLPSGRVVTGAEMTVLCAFYAPSTADRSAW